MSWPFGHLQNIQLMCLSLSLSERMLSKLAFLLQKSSDDYWVIWLKATCLSWRPGEYLSWRTGEHLYVLYLSLVKLFPTLLFFSHFCIMIIERGFADLSIESSFNIQVSVSQSIQLGRLCQVRFTTHVIKSWRTRDFDQGWWWWWWWKLNRVQKFVTLVFSGYNSISVTFFAPKLFKISNRFLPIKFNRTWQCPTDMMA